MKFSPHYKRYAAWIVPGSVGRGADCAVLSDRQFGAYRIKTITGTLAIEGNTLTEEQITAIEEGKSLLGSVRELAEVKGAIAAYEALPELHPANLDHLLAAHGLMMGETM